MICPLYLQAKQSPNDLYLILNARTISFSHFHQQVQACTDYLRTIPTTAPLAISSDDIFALLSWIFAAARTGHRIAIPSTKDPSDQRDRILQTLNMYTESLLWTLPPLKQPISEMAIPRIKDPHSPWIMLFTSGSSGAPKVVVHSFASLWSSANFSQQNIPFSKGDRWLQSLFLWHIGGLMIPIRALFGGASVVQKDRLLTLPDQIEGDRISHLSLVATQLQDLLRIVESEKRSFSSIKAILVGGGAIPNPLVERAITQHLPIHTTYGMTELGSQLTTTPPNASLQLLQSAGYPLGDWQIRIGDQQEIQVKGSPLFLGYWNGLTIEDPRDHDGYFGTSDRGIIQNKALYPIGRVDQMFISGGENIHPEEIEQHFQQLDLFAIVVPIPDERYGKRPLAFVLVDTISKSLHRQITDLLAQSLPKFKHPDHILPWPTGVSTYKPSRKQLTDIAEVWIKKQRSL